MQNEKLKSFEMRKKGSSVFDKAVLTTEITMAFEGCLTVHLPHEII